MKKIVALLLLTSLAHLSAMEEKSTDQPVEVKSAIKELRQKLVSVVAFSILTAIQCLSVYGAYKSLDQCVPCPDGSSVHVEDMINGLTAIMFSNVPMDIIIRQLPANLHPGASLNNILNISRGDFSLAIRLVQDYLSNLKPQIAQQLLRLSPWHPRAE